MAKRANNKYSPEFKKKAVEKYLSGEIGGVKLASRALGLRSSTQLRQQIKLYRENPELLKQDNRGKASAKHPIIFSLLLRAPRFISAWWNTAARPRSAERSAT